jgi:hypothetical protein
MRTVRRVLLVAGALGALAFAASWFVPVPSVVYDLSADRPLVLSVIEMRALGAALLASGCIGYRPTTHAWLPSAAAFGLALFVAHAAWVSYWMQRWGVAPRSIAALEPGSVAPWIVTVDRALPFVTWVATLPAIAMLLVTLPLRLRGGWMAGLALGIVWAGAITLHAADAVVTPRSRPLLLVARDALGWIDIAALMLVAWRFVELAAARESRISSTP